MSKYPGKLMEIIDEFGWFIANKGNSEVELTIPAWKKALKEYITDHAEYQKILKAKTQKEFE